jgi:hypothetical protein
MPPRRQQAALPTHRGRADTRRGQPARSRPRPLGRRPPPCTGAGPRRRRAALARVTAGGARHGFRTASGPPGNDVKGGVNDVAAVSSSSSSPSRMSTSGVRRRAIATSPSGGDQPSHGGPRGGQLQRQPGAAGPTSSSSRTGIHRDRLSRRQRGANHQRRHRQNPGSPRRTDARGRTRHHCFVDSGRTSTPPPRARQASQDFWKRPCGRHSETPAQTEVWTVGRWRVRSVRSGAIPTPESGGPHCSSGARSLEPAAVVAQHFS